MRNYTLSLEPFLAIVNRIFLSLEFGITPDIPDELFTKPQLQASITVSKDAVSAPVIEADVVDNISEIISKELGIDLNIAVVPNQ